MKEAEEKENLTEEEAFESTTEGVETSVEEAVDLDDVSESVETAQAEDPDVLEEPEVVKPDPQEEAATVQLLRLRADFDNFRKRTRREKEEWTQRCLENLCTDLLTVLDHFDLGIDNCKGQEAHEEMLKGFEMVRGQLGTTLGKYGLSVLEVQEKDAFDPNEHEAITHLPSPEVPEGAVVAMTRKGYRLGNRLLRPAQVVVSSGTGGEG